MLCRAGDSAGDESSLDDEEPATGRGVDVFKTGMAGTDSGEGSGAPSSEGGGDASSDEEEFALRRRGASGRQLNGIKPLRSPAAAAAEQAAAVASLLPRGTRQTQNGVGAGTLEAPERTASLSSDEQGTSFESAPAHATFSAPLARLTCSLEVKAVLRHPCTLSDYMPAHVPDLNVLQQCISMGCVMCLACQLSSAPA